jgi:TRAP-type transport system periplasmic protein
MNREHQKGEQGMVNIRSTLLTTLALGLSILLLFSPLSADATEYRLGLNFEDPADSRHGQLAERFAELVHDYTDGRVEIVTYPGGQQGNYQTVIEGMQIGTHDMVRVFDAMSPLLPEVDVFNMPYLFGSRETFERVIDDPVVEEVLAQLEDRGIVALAWWENGFRHMTNSVRPIAAPEDLEGLKMRTPPSPGRMAMFHEFGANPAPLPYIELYSALQQGVFDGQENPLNNVRSAKFYEVQDYLSLTAHVYNPQLLAISKIRWDSLPDWAREALVQAGREVGQMYRDGGQRLDDEDLAYLKQRMEVNEVDFEAFRRAAEPLYVASEHQELLRHLLDLAR